MIASIARRLDADTHTRSLFLAAFPETGGRIDLQAIQQALASFQRGLLAFDTDYDRYRQGGDTAALSASAKAGLALFEDPTVGCALCHVPPLFTDATPPRLFEGTRLGAEDPRQWRRRRAALGAGHGTITDREGRLLRVPALRNLSVTGPYMHDARFAALADLLADYRVPQRGTTGGRDRLSEAEQAALLAFLRALDDQTFLTDQRFASPYRDAAVRAGDPAPPTLP
jgi:cytochrome c peroxidase